MKNLLKIETQFIDFSIIVLSKSSFCKVYSKNAISSIVNFISIKMKFDSSEINSA